MLQVTINGRSTSCASEGTILAALRAAGVDVPTLCDDPRLVPIGACRLCLVEVEGQPRPVAACTTPLAPAMVIRTHTPRLEEIRRTILRLLASGYPAQAVHSDPASSFHRLLRAYGLEHELRGEPQASLVDDSHPCIHVDMSQCIACYRCVRICAEVVGQFVWRAWNRGDRTEIRPANCTNLLASDCIACGACVDTCPTGALADKAARRAGAIDREVRTVCPYCGTGCEMHVGVRRGRLVTARPALDAPVNKGHLCVKGRYGLDFVHAADRVTAPMVREHGQWKTVSWDEAIERVAGRLRSIIAQHGADGVGVLGSARATNEENYLAQKFARVVLGTNNVDCCARVCHAPTAAGMKMMLGAGAATNSFDDIEWARAILVCGANPSENHPIVGARIKQAALRGARLIVIDPRRTDLAECAAVHLQLRPGTDIPLLNAIACTIVEENLFDPAASARVGEWDEFCRFIADFTPQRVAELCGVDAQSIRRAAREYAINKPAMSIHGLGVTEHVQGTEGVMCLVNLALVTGNLGIPGAGVNPLRGQNNVQGAAHMGCDPGILTGSAPLADAAERFESVWHAPIPTRPGLNLMKMIDAAAGGRFRALWVMGYDVALTSPMADATIAALRSLDPVIVQDMFLTQTARLAATIFLPAANSFEKDGTFMNSERRIQRVRKVVDPPGECRADWRIICDVAAAMGHRESFTYKSAEEIWDEIRAVWPAGAGISYERLDERGLQWPCPTVDHPGTAIMHTDIFARPSARPALRRIAPRPAAETVSAEYPLLLTTGRALYQFNAGTMTSRSQTHELRPIDLLLVSPEDAQSLGIGNGQTVRIKSCYGEATICASISTRVRRGEVFATFHSPETFLNRVISDRRDRFVQTPDYKVTAVRVHPVGESEPIALPG